MTYRVASFFSVSLRIDRSWKWWRRREANEKRQHETQWNYRFFQFRRCWNYLGKLEVNNLIFDFSGIIRRVGCHPSMRLKHQHFLQLTYNYILSFMLSDFLFVARSSMFNGSCWKQPLSSSVGDYFQLSLWWKKKMITVWFLHICCSRNTGEEVVLFLLHPTQQICL